MTEQCTAFRPERLCGAGYVEGAGQVSATEKETGDGINTANPG